MPLSLAVGGEWHRRGRRRADVDKPARTGSRMANLDYCAHGGPAFRTLMRAMIEAGYNVPVLCHYDAGLAGGAHRSSQSAATPIALAERHWAVGGREFWAAGAVDEPDAVGVRVDVGAGPA